MKGFLIAMQFFTAIPIPVKNTQYNEEFGSSSKFLPLIGLIIGILLVVSYQLFSAFFPTFVVASLIIFLEILLTGGIHLDGFIDSCDGLFSARTNEKVLEIMKDSRVGAHSIIAFFSLYLLKFTVILSLLSIFRGYLFIMIMPVIGRWLMLYCVAFFPYAREDGLGKLFKQETPQSYWYIWTFLIIPLIVFLLSLKYLFVLVITFLIVLSIMMKISSKLGGHTGDTYGFINELSEVIFLIFCLVF